MRGAEEKDDGLLLFLHDIFKNLQMNEHFVVNLELYEVTMKIRNVLIIMADTLYELYEANPDELRNVE